MDEVGKPVTSYEYIMLFVKIKRKMPGRRMPDATPATAMDPGFATDSENPKKQLHLL
jgi:hypothetical protein